MAFYLLLLQQNCWQVRTHLMPKPEFFSIQVVICYLNQAILLEKLYTSYRLYTHYIYTVYIAI